MGLAEVGSQCRNQGSTSDMGTEGQLGRREGRLVQGEPRRGRWALQPGSWRQEQDMWGQGGGGEEASSHCLAVHGRGALGDGRCPYSTFTRGPQGTVKLVG